VRAGLPLERFAWIAAPTDRALWTAEQCLRAGCCGAVLSWMPMTDYRQLRRLQLAAESGSALAFVFRPLGVARETSPAALRLCVSVSGNEPRIDVLKCRGRFGENAQAVPLRV